MDRNFKVIALSENYKRGLRIADTIVARKKLDKAFEKNMRIKQAIGGIVICLVSDAIGLWLAENGCEPILLETAIFNVLGLHFITTDILYEKELRNEEKKRRMG